MDKKISYKLMFDNGNANFEIAGFADRESAEQKRETNADRFLKLRAQICARLE